MEKVAAVAPQGVNCKTFSSNFSHRRLLKKSASVPPPPPPFGLVRCRVLAGRDVLPLSLSFSHVPSATAKFYARRS